MIYLGISFTAYLAFSLWYIHRLHERLDSYENDWYEIEKLTDHNQSGDIVIHARKVPDHIPTPWHNHEEDEAELYRLIDQRDQLNKEITALAQLMSFGG